jgi:hypothetical protein
MKNDNSLGSCFWKHKWGKWKQYSQTMISRDNGQRYYDYRQQRQCLRCGKVQDELIN